MGLFTNDHPYKFVYKFWLVKHLDCCGFIINVLNIIWSLIFFLSKIKKNGVTAKNPTKNLTELKVNGPMLSIPVSWAIKVVPQINVQATKQINDIIFFIK